MYVNIYIYTVYISIIFVHGPSLSPHSCALRAARCAPFPTTFHFEEVDSMAKL